MSKYKVKPAKPEQLSTYPLCSRPSKVTIDTFGRACDPGGAFKDFFDSLPDVLAAGDLKKLVSALHRAKENRKAVIFAMGAHVIKVGLAPVLIDLMQNGWISALALNGAGIIHDFEVAFAGRTSEDVEAQLKDGSFGMAEETGDYLNEAINIGARKGLGLGEAVGRMLVESDFPYREHSLLASAYALDIPVTVHVAVGTDIIHFHPKVRGDLLGQTTLQDFFLFCSLVEGLEGGGVYMNCGSAVILPEIFLKALSFARNRGVTLEEFTTAVFDFNRHYRPWENVVKRPVGDKGKGYYFIGHHEIMIPLLAAALKA